MSCSKENKEHNEIYIKKCPCQKQINKGNIHKRKTIKDMTMQCLTLCCLKNPLRTFYQLKARVKEFYNCHNHMTDICMIVPIYI